MTKTELEKASLELTLQANIKLLKKIKKEIRYYINRESDIEDRIEDLKFKLKELEGE